jgi:beta-phosphoglucomutase-like phosphatase (HAD superfamily)
MTTIERRQQPAPPVIDQAVEHLRRETDAMRQEQAEQLQHLERAVCALRALGGSWADVAAATGLPRATVHRRFRHVDFGAMAIVRGPAGAALLACNQAGEQVVDVTQLVALDDDDRARQLLAAGIRALVA